MREHGPLSWLPTQVGIAIHLPFERARYSTVGFTLPFALISSAITSSTGSRCSELPCGCQLGKARMSWPDLACCSAAMVRRFLWPCEVM